MGESTANKSMDLEVVKYGQVFAVLDYLQVNTFAAVALTKQSTTPQQLTPP
jgi:hypothetical protein